MFGYPGYMISYPWSSRSIPSSFILPSQWHQPHNDELLLAIQESDLDEKLNEIRKMNSDLIVIGKTTVDNDKEEIDNDADEDDADNAEESEGDDFEQETG
ncbi:hypothetical protein Leryth_021844 [Lithospermum erythrorhizon]|uniref:Uncharacterized protein n=1 Tax=Lithospermum erythrorhizon TaxID=34254 RepID=A0AAV3RIS2_LITER|nr:hypothetical protein Leryth_021844 [Lithospermum erythrorhizon]